MMNSKMILSYGLEEKDLEVFKISNLEYRVITTEISHKKIEEIIEGTEGEKRDKELPNEKVILFNNFSDEELSNLIKIIRATIGKSAILAVITDTSKEWSFDYLMEHLIEEREWYKKMQQEKGRN